MRWLGIGLLLLGVLGFVAMLVEMMLTFQTAGSGPAPNPAGMANRLAFTLNFVLPAGLCIVGGLVVLIVDFVQRRSRRSG